LSYLVFDALQVTLRVLLLGVEFIAQFTYATSHDPCKVHILFRWWLLESCKFYGRFCTR